MTLPAHTPASSASPTLPLAVTQPVAVQPVPQAMEDVSSAQPSAFQSALDHAPVESTLAQLQASVIPAGAGAQEQEAHEAQGPVVFHTSPQKLESKARESTPQALSTQGKAPASQSMTQAGGATSSTTRSSSSGCCDDPATTYILWDDGGSCAVLINACATGVLRTCNALARLPGAARDCLPSSQSLHNGCNRLVSAAGQCCEGFGHCLTGGLEMCGDIICCPCTTCGKLCEACCDGLQDPSCCATDDICCCCCTDCDCSGCDCNC